MRFLIQRVTNAKVEVEKGVIGSIDKGLVVFIGIGSEDNREIADKLIKKLIGLRIFEDDEGKTNLSINDVNGKLLLISQFTLYANCKKGNRPSFIEAGSPDMSEALYNYIVSQCIAQMPGRVERGSFGADMEVSLQNSGPFTIFLDSESMLSK